MKTSKCWKQGDTVTNLISISLTDYNYNKTYNYIHFQRQQEKKKKYVEMRCNFNSFIYPKKADLRDWFDLFKLIYTWNNFYIKKNQYTYKTTTTEQTNFNDIPKLC